MTMTEKVTREDLRQIPVGGSRTFGLPNAKACDNAKTVAYQLQRVLGCKFSAKTNYEDNSVTFTKTEL